MSRPRQAPPRSRTGLPELRKRLHAAEETLRAIRAGEVDAVMVRKPTGEKAITLAGAELAYRVLFDQMNEGAVTLTVDGVIAYCNRRFAAIVEAPLARVLGMPFRRFVPRAGHRSLAALLEGGSRAGIRSELTLRSWTGTPVPASVSFAPLQLEPGAAVSGVIGVIADISERKRAQASHSQLVQQVLTAQEEERRRVARELHDETGQSLTALLVGLRTIEGSRTIADASRLAKQLREVAAQTLLDVGRLSRGLHPSILDDMGLGAAVTRHAQEFARVHGISVESRIEGFDANRLPLLVQTTVYRVLQEALTNVAKHAEARSTSIHLVRDETAVELRVQDDGAGFAPAPGRAPVEQRRRLGLQGMRERAALLGGSIRVESSPGRGATITARFPLDGAVMPGSERSPAAPGRGQ